MPQWFKKSLSSSTNSVLQGAYLQNIENLPPLRSTRRPWDTHRQLEEEEGDAILLFLGSCVQTLFMGSTEEERRGRGALLYPFSPSPIYTFLRPSFQRPPMGETSTVKSRVAADIIAFFCHISLKLTIEIISELNRAHRNTEKTPHYNYSTSPRPRGGQQVDQDSLMTVICPLEQLRCSAPSGNPVGRRSSLTASSYTRRHVLLASYETQVGGVDLNDCHYS